MNDAEKLAAFANLTDALTNRWADGTWTWWCPTPSGCETHRQTKEEAIVDLVAWAERMAKKQRNKNSRSLPVIS